MGTPLIVGRSVASQALVPELTMLDTADKEVAQQFVGRIRRQILSEMAAGSTEERGGEET